MTGDGGAERTGADAERVESALSSYVSEHVQRDVSVAAVRDLSHGGVRRTFAVELDDEAPGSLGASKLVVRLDSDGRTGMERDLRVEYDVLDHLDGVDVPTSAPIAFESDDSILGEQFFVVEALPGRTPNVFDPADRQWLYDHWESDRAGLPTRVVEVLATVHDVPPAAVPGLSVPASDEAIERTLDAVEAAYRRFARTPQPVVEEGLRWLRANAPSDVELTLVHGDFHAENLLVDDGRLSGVVDWENTAICDPMYDLGHATNPLLAGDVLDPVDRPELACCLAEREWFYETYGQLTGRTVSKSRVRYWRAFATLLGLVGILRLSRWYEHRADPELEWLFAQYGKPRYEQFLLEAIRADQPP